MDFDTLLNYCIKLNESTNEKCLVCHIPLEKNDSHLKLKCNHLFHKNCIGYIKGTIKCLYCDKSSIPEIINGDNSFIHEISNGDKPISLIIPEILCKVIIKSGLHKGQYCNRSICKYHKLTKQDVIVINPSTNQINLSTNQINKCLFILKSGKNCGNICGRDLPCNYHKINEDIGDILIEV